MKFLWPEMLWLLLMVPALVAAYFFLLRRKKEDALRYASLSMVKEAMGAGQRFRRHIPPLLFLVALIAMIVAIARPAAVVTLPSQHQTIILAMDVSGSMRATDVEPNRISAAQAAAKAFVAEQPSSVLIGVVSFAATASVVQPPTHNREDILAAIDRFQLQRGTAIGIGTTSGENLGFEGWSMRVRLDEETLKAIANMTRGEYFYAGTARDLKKVYESLNARLVLEKKDMEISALFSAAAAVTALVSALLSLLWFNRIL